MTIDSSSFPPGFYPFWFWNGDMTPDEIRHQIAEMAAKGIRGFYIHPRQGLTVPYLSAAFFDRVRLAADCAAEHGMTCELYDEFPYPSGPAGGLATLGRPEFQATKLIHKRLPLQVHADGDELRVPLPACHLLQLTAFPADADERVTDWSAGRDLTALCGVTYSRASFMAGGLTSYNQKRFLEQDPVPTLMTTDLPAGHWVLIAVGQIAIRNNKYFGDFLDVMNPAAVQEFLRLTHHRYGQELGDRIGSVCHSIFVDETCPHWSSCIPAVFRERTGRDIGDYFPAFFSSEHPDHYEAVAVINQIQLDRFIEAWEIPYGQACREIGLLYTGEKPAWRLSHLRYQDMPGADPGHTKAGAWPDCFKSTIRANARAVASAAYFYDKPACVVECYHSLGWTATIQDAKLIADLLMLAGIDHLVPHGFFYSSHGLRKHDAPASFFEQMPNWQQFGALSEHVDQVLTTFADTHVPAAVLMVEPSWGQPSTDDRETYQAMMWALLQTHCDFLHADTDILETGQIDGATLRIKDLAIDAIALPPMPYIEPPLQAWLDRWTAAGGRVLSSEADCRAYAEMWNSGHQNLAITNTSERAEGVAPVISVRRRDAAGKTWAFIVNAGDQPASIAIGGAQLAFAPFESRLLDLATAVAEPEPLPVVELDLSAGLAAELELLSPNTLRIDDWDLSVAPIDGDFSPSARVNSLPIANQLEQGKIDFTPPIKHGFGVTSSLIWPTLRLRYRARFSIETDVPTDAAILIEPDGIVGDWSLSVNGQGVRQSAFAPVDEPVRGTLAAPAKSLLRAGENTIEIHVQTDRPDGGVLNPIYLRTGQHRVDLLPGQDPVVSAPRGRGLVESYLVNGLPHFAGVLRYSVATDDEGTTAAPRDYIAMLRSQGHSPDTQAEAINMLATEYGMETFDLADYEIPADLLMLVSSTVATCYQIVPVMLHDNVLTIAMADPSSIETLDELRAALDMDIEAVISPEAQIQRALKRYYDADLADAPRRLPPVDSAWLLKLTGCQEALRVKVGDGPWRDSVWEPRELRIEAGEYTDGATIQIEVASTLGRYFDGLEWDAKAHKIVDVAPKS